MTMGYAWGIILTTVAMRTLFMPMTLITQKNMFRMKLINPEIEEYRGKMMAEYKSGNRRQGEIYKQELAVLMRRYNVSQTLPLINMAMIPAFITYFISLRFMVFQPELFPGIASSQFFWLNDLSQADPYFILPFISAIFNYIGLVINKKLNPVSPSTPAAIKKFHQFLPALPFVGALFMSTFPAGLNLYWLMLSISQATATSLFLIPSFNRFIGIPKYFPGTKMAAELGYEDNKNYTKAVFSDDTKQLKEGYVKVYTKNPKLYRKNK